ncbi:MAG: NlpC/P60 family protein [Actinomycetota bacterium]|nr:NlpC/P60 family protein [Actinomycetota bacterium]
MRKRSAVLSSVLVAAMFVSLGTLSTTSAAPRKDLKEVEQQVRELQMEAGFAEENVKGAQARLDGISRQLDTIQDRADRERAELRVAVSTIDDIARAQYTSGGLDPTLQVLMAEDPAEFLAQAAVMGQIEQTQLSQLRRARTSRLRLAQTEAEISDREAASQLVRDELAAAEESLASRLAAAEEVLATLQEEERQRLAQIAEERRQQQIAEAAAATQAAQQANASSEGGSPDTGPSGGGSPDNGPSGGGSPDNGSAESGGGFAGGSRAQAAVQYALAQVGEPYSYSARPPDSWDCSKLTAAAWGSVGVSLTALSYIQWDETRRVPVSDIQPGDLVFYFGSGARHVAIYIGNGKMVSASNPRDGVEIIDYLGPWYNERFSGVGRVVG